MVTLAIETSASITPVENEAAAMLGEHGGVAALLRY
jgi:stalled ribosome rescue protein Dom34